jgi:hypothetical protein
MKTGYTVRHRESAPSAREDEHKLRTREREGDSQAAAELRRRRQVLIVNGREIPAGAEITLDPGPEFDFEADGRKWKVVVEGGATGHRQVAEVTDVRPDLDELVMRGVACPPKPGKCPDCDCRRSP